MRYWRLVPIACLLWAPLLPGDAMYVLHDLGTLGGGAQATGLNASGEAVGFVEGPDGSLQPASFAGGTLLSGGQGEAAAINNRGVVAGTLWGSGVPQAVQWKNGQVRTLTGLGGAGSYALAINDAGGAAGSATLGSGNAHAVVWNANSVRDLGTLGGTWSAAYGINNSGIVTGTSETASNSFEAFLSAPGSAMRSLGTLGGTSSAGMAINDRGEVAGASQLASGYYHAFTYQNGFLSDLGTLGGDASYAYGLNSAGDVVGYSDTSRGISHGFLYESGVLLDLNAFLPLSSGWDITDAMGINNQGDIVGSALRDGALHAIELTPGQFTDPPSAAPEPLPIFGVGIALIICGVLHRRGANRRTVAALKAELDQNKEINPLTPTLDQPGTLYHATFHSTPHSTPHPPVE